jgi:hypothetical protein
LESPVDSESVRKLASAVNHNLNFRTESKTATELKSLLRG